ncbi:MAG: ABC transporter substrate-binding protein [Chloroflexi bacterium]|nr:ABC transporter substrate-binding protein [Chloroflexota bacterium]
MHDLSRREFLRISSLAAVGSLAAACASPGTPAPQPGGASDPAPTEAPGQPAAPAPSAPGAEGRFGEVPMLADLVASGELPPVEERLPESPSVYPVLEMTGKYGGTIRRGFTGVTDRTGPSKIVDISLVHFDTDLSIRPDICESWEQNADATLFTIHLRKGMKWSDGEPFDASAFTYYYDHVATNKDISPVMPERLSTGTPSVPATLEAVDDYTVVIEFAHPNPIFMQRLNRSQIFAPAHYMRRFHIELTDDTEALQSQVEAAGFNTWADHYSDRDQWWANPERPSVSAWLAQNDLANEIFVVERNPYFCAVDPDGQQLPYVDRITHRLFEKPDVFNMWILNGEIDWQHRHVDLGNYTLLKDGEQSGGYRVMEWIGGTGATLYINHNCRDPRIAEFMQDRNVRKALNLAMNRDEINQLVYDGIATPRQASPISASPYYHEGAATAYIDYDPEQANALLDEAGYSERNGEGMRLWKDGSGDVLSFVMEGWATGGSVLDDAAQMLVRYLTDVGITCSWKSQERFLVYERSDSNNVEAVFRDSGHEIFLFLREHPYIGNATHHPWGGGWGIWYQNPEDPNAEEPPEGHFLWDVWDLWERANVEPDDAQRKALVSQMFDIWAEEVPVVGILGELPSLVVVKDGLRNCGPGFAQTDPTADENLIGTPTLFWEEPELHA